MYVQAPKGAEAGDYGAFLNIRQVSAPKIEGETKENEIGAGMMVMVNVDMGLYGYVGDKVPKLETSEPKFIKEKDGQKLQMEVRNLTNRLVRMKLEVKTTKNYFYTVGESRVLKGQTLEFDHIVPRMKNDEEAKEIVITDVETKEIIKKVKVK